jgi:hypothetical protein
VKKITIILLMLVYSLSSLGIDITVHYCMSNMVAWEFAGTGAGSKCDNCGMKKQGHKGCCHDEKKIFKTRKDQKNVEAFLHILKSPVVEISTNFLLYSASYLPNPSEELPYGNAPPYNLKVPIYINDCVFRI